VTKLEGETVVTSRFMDNIKAPPFWRLALRGNHLADDVPVDRWQICRFAPPSHVMIEVGVAHAGHGGYHASDEHKVSSVVVDFITPESEHSIWYFWGMARQFNPSDKSLTASIREGQGKIFSEDRAILERQQQNMLTHPNRKLLKLNIDSGGVYARRMLDGLLAKEAAVASDRLSA
jgi:vanillate monooxygenase